MTSDPEKAVSLALALKDVNRSMIGLVGGKAANLGDMINSSSIIPVPPGFVVTSEAYMKFIGAAEKYHHGMFGKNKIHSLLKQLDELADDEMQEDLVTSVRDVGSKIRTALENVPFPTDVLEAIKLAWKELEREYYDCEDETEIEPLAVAVRSSATAEDLPSASFAGQHDTYLNVTGYEAALVHIRRCWISLFTDRTIAYRIKNHFEHRLVRLCVVVQAQICPTSSGIMFTANVMNGKRSDTVIEAGFGLGEALVSGLINADSYKFDRSLDKLVEVNVGDKSLEIIPVEGKQCTKTVQLEESRRKLQVLNETQIRALVQAGQMIQDHYDGQPQDIEWCIEKGSKRLFIVQSRPITTLFPVPNLPAGSDPKALRVYVSFGHVQVMTSPVSPCGISVFSHVTSRFAGTELETGESYLTRSAGSCYLYLDMTRLMQIPLARNNFTEKFKIMSAAIAVSVQEVVEREEFLATSHSVISNIAFLFKLFLVIGPVFILALWRLLIQPNPDGMKRRASELVDCRVAETRKRVRSCDTDKARFLAGLGELEHIFYDIRKVAPYAMAGILAFAFLRKLTDAENNEVAKSDCDALARGLSGNVTTDMDLEIGDLADVARSEPVTSEWLKNGKDLTKEGLQNLLTKDGTEKFKSALMLFLDKYGCRCAGEIDIGRTRWNDDPSAILQVLRGNLMNEEVGHHRSHHEKLAKAGEEAGHRIILSASPFSRPIVRHFVTRARTLAAIREHHKLMFIQVMYELRRAILELAANFVKSGKLESIDDIWMLKLEEIASSFDWDENKIKELVKSRQEQYARDSKFKPPAVLTSDGECVNKQPHNANIPEGALGGLPVSSGVVEGIAKVVLDPMTAVLNSGEILVCPCTDPGWTPLFINAAAVVMEVGGYLTVSCMLADLTDSFPKN